MATIYTRAGKGSALTWTEGDANVTNLNTAKIENVVEDTTPQLGGNLDVQARTIFTSGTDQTIEIAPSGTGFLRVGDGSLPGKITSKGAKNLALSTNDNTDSGMIVINQGVDANIALLPNGTGRVAISGNYVLPQTAPTAGQVLTATDTFTTAFATPTVAVSTGISGLGTGVATALAVNTGSAGAPVLFNGALGTPSSGTVTNLTGTASININGTVGATTAAAGTFTTLSALTGGGLASLTVAGGSVTIGYPNAGNGNPRLFLPVAAGNGTLENVNVGATWPGTGAFTTLSASNSVSFSPSGAITLNPTTAGTINNMSIGATTASTGRFSTLTATGTTTLATSLTGLLKAASGVVSAATAGTDYVAVGGALGTPSSGTVTNLTGTASININGTVGATTKAAGTFTTMTADTAVLDDIRETVYAIGNSGASTLTPNAANGSIQTITATGNFTLSAFTSPVSGQTITFIITQDGTGSRTLTSTMKFAGGSKTLTTTANAIDILTVSYIGTTYYASLSKAFA
jgi:hypothetical protein